MRFFRSLLLSAVCLLGGLTGCGSPSTGTPTNACSKLNGGCDVNALCSDTTGVVTCRCTDGYRGDGKSCEPIQYCANDNNPCDSDASCTIENGFPKCVCHDGFSGDGFRCQQKPRCDVKNGGCDLNNALCSTDPNGKVQCECKENYEGDGYTCVALPTCNPDPCDANATCSIVEKAVKCECKTGYEGDGFNCADKNECAPGGGAVCSANANCNNTVGSYTCSCKMGFSGNGKVCDDVNECDTNNGGCHANAICGNTAPGRTCTCGPNYDGDGVTCTPKDPCTNGSNTCDLTTSKCTYTGPNTYQCDCNLGYELTGTNICSPINYCDATHVNVCDKTTSNCVYTGPGTYDCGCKTGYKDAGNKTCVAINRCTDGSNNCDAATTTCNYTGPGTFTCDCKTNYEAPTGTSCSPINHCSAGHVNSCNVATSTCNYTGPNTYDCTCRSGFQHPTNGGVPDPYVCENINECTTYGNTSANTCSDNAKCTDRTPTLGDPSKFTCACNDGFFGTAYYSSSGPTCLPRFTQVAVGNQHICAIRADTAGTLVCWGWNTLGQFGSGTVQTCSGTCSPILTPVAVNMTPITQWESTHGGASSWVKIVAGADTTCGIRGNSDLWCWGANTYGQIGNNSTTNQSLPVLVATGTKWSDITTDTDHTFGVSTITGGNGQVFAWGQNMDYQLGTGDTAPHLSPTPLNLSAPPAGPNFLSVGAGYLHGCALDAAGKIYCWGRNTYGQLGQVTDSSQPGYVPYTSTPLEIQAANPSGSPLTSTGWWDRLYAGYYSNCALQADSTTTGSLWCWGSNVSGQLGDRTQTDRTAPVPVRNNTNGVDSWWLGVVNGNTSVASVALGESHTCGIKADQTIACWGNNTSNQLGKGSNLPATQLYPQPISQISGVPMMTQLHFNRISARKSITCAITEDQPGQIPQSEYDQRLVCWGGTIVPNAFAYGPTPVFVNK